MDYIKFQKRFNPNIDEEFGDVGRYQIIEEFEDLLPNSLIARTLNYATQNISLAPIDELEEATSKVEFLEEFFKHRGVHEFKKAEFANLVKQNIKDISDVSEEIVEIIDEIKGTYSPLKNGV